MPVKRAASPSLETLAKRSRFFPSLPASLVPTRCLVVSDNHSVPFLDQLPAADVVIHCGNLTEGSTLEEMRRAVDFLRRLKAPLKIVVPGSHDFSLDPVARRRHRVQLGQTLADDHRAVCHLDTLFTRTYGTPAEPRALFEAASACADGGVRLLDEQGNYRFSLDNGASLRVFASPRTPTPSDSGWGFEYNPAKGHGFFDMGLDSDIVVTHGPPRGILDRRPGMGQRAGCGDLFEAVARTRPKMHCFGHVHQGWGASHVQWRGAGLELLSHVSAAAVDIKESTAIETPATLRPTELDTGHVEAEKRSRSERHESRGYCEARAPAAGAGTLFVNASNTGQEGILDQLPWLVTIGLPRDGGDMIQDIEVAPDGAEMDIDY